MRHTHTQTTMILHVRTSSLDRYTDANDERALRRRRRRDFVARVRCVRNCAQDSDSDDDWNGTERKSADGPKNERLEYVARRPTSGRARARSPALMCYAMHTFAAAAHARTLNAARVRPLQTNNDNDNYNGQSRRLRLLKTTYRPNGLHRIACHSFGRLAANGASRSLTFVADKRTESSAYLRPRLSSCARAHSINLLHARPTGLALALCLCSSASHSSDRIDRRRRRTKQNAHVRSGAKQQWAHSNGPLARSDDADDIT